MEIPKQSYDFMERRKEVGNRLNAFLEDLRQRRPYFEVLKDSEKKDVCTLYVEGKVEEIKRLEKQINSYEDKGMHFTKLHRTLEGHCGKLQVELDRVDEVGRSDLEISKKEALLQIDKLIKLLSTKVHAGGQTCGRCEVKK